MIDTNPDKLLEKIHTEILEEEIEHFNDYIVQLFHNPKNWGRPPDKEIDVSQAYTGPCGDTIQFFLKINDDIIENASFITDGCIAAVTTASQTTLLIKGKSLNFAEKLKAKVIDSALEGLPKDHKHCAKLALRALKGAIKKYKKKIKPKEIIMENNLDSETKIGLKRKKYKKYRFHLKSNHIHDLSPTYNEHRTEILKNFINRIVSIEDFRNHFQIPISEPKFYLDSLEEALIIKKVNGGWELTSKGITYLRNSKSKMHQ